MATNTKTKVVDIIPEFGLNGDYKKITEYDFVALNAKIFPVITLCLMERGSNQLMPDMGLRNTLCAIPFSERDEVEAIIAGEISTQIKTYINVDVKVYIDESKTNWLEGDVYLAMDIAGVPGTLSIGVNKDKVNDMQPFNIKHPAIFTK
jgi:hypothetical protein